jgi:hypothetical protein
VAISRLLQILQYLSRATGIYGTFREPAPSLDCLRAADLQERDSLGFAGLKAEKLSGRQIKMIAIGFLAIEFKVGIGLHEMKV